MKTRSLIASPGGRRAGLRRPRERFACVAEGEGRPARKQSGGDGYRARSCRLGRNRCRPRFCRDGSRDRLARSARGNPRRAGGGGPTRPRAQGGRGRPREEGRRPCGARLRDDGIPGRPERRRTRACKRRHFACAEPDRRGRCAPRGSQCRARARPPARQVEVPVRECLRPARRRRQDRCGAAHRGQGQPELRAGREGAGRGPAARAGLAPQQY